jgi:hypothetical protein
MPQHSPRSLEFDREFAIDINLALWIYSQVITRPRTSEMKAFMHGAGACGEVKWILKIYDKVLVTASLSYPNPHILENATWFLLRLASFDT